MVVEHIAGIRLWPGEGWLTVLRKVKEKKKQARFANRLTFIRVEEIRDIDVISIKW